MNKLDIIFYAFVKANELQPRVARRGAEWVYHNLFCTKGEIQGTEEFAGFVDGYEGRASKYEGPIGSPKLKGKMDELTDKIITSIRRTGNLEIVRETEEIIEEQLENSPEAIYKRQYTLGKNYRGGVRGDAAPLINDLREEISGLLSGLQEMRGAIENPEEPIQTKHKKPNFTYVAGGKTTK